MLAPSDETALSREAQACGFGTMLDDGLAKLADGVIGFEELVRVVGTPG
jgi:hypothetical protein